MYTNVHKIVFTVITEKKNGGDRNKWRVNSIRYATQNETEEQTLQSFGLVLIIIKCAKLLIVIKKNG